MAVRYPGCHLHLGMYSETFGVAEAPDLLEAIDTLDNSNDTYISGDSHGLFVSPAKYSEVRKVAFWMVPRWEQTGGAGTFDTQLRVMPRRDSDAATEASVINLPKQTAKRTAGTGFDINQTFTAAKIIADAPSSKKNQIKLTQIPTNATDGFSGLLWVEYDRFAPDAASIEFFQIWDAAAALTTDDYICFQMAIQRLDGVGWADATGSTTNPPKIAGVGMSVIQTGAENNKTCTMWAGHWPTHPAAAITGYISNNRAGGGFPYISTDWDGITEVTALMRQFSGDADAGAIDYKLQTFDNTGIGPLTDVGAEDTLDDSSGGVGNAYIYRTRDFFSDIQSNGDANYCINIKQDTGAGTTMVNYQWEVTQENATKKVTPMWAGVGHQIADGDLGTDDWGRDASLFDPLWFEDWSDEVLDSQVWGEWIHVTSVSLDNGMQVYINAALDESPTTSATTVAVTPQITGTPYGTAAYKYKYDSIDDENVNPLNLSGKRYMTVKMFGTWSATNIPENAGLAFKFTLPSSEGVDYGPLFQLDAFNPEGCASTAAGLGDNPGILAITNGSVAPQKFNPVDQTISDLGFQPPYRGEDPAATPADDSDSPVGGLSLGTYYYRYTFRNSCTGKESDPSPSYITVDTSGQSPAAKVTLSFAGVTIPADDQIDEICIYRSVEGGDQTAMYKVGCFNIDATSVFVDQMDDTVLLDQDPLSFLNGPPPCCPIVAEFRNRLFLMGDIPRLSPDGTVDVVNGSDEMEFSTDASIDRCEIGRFIQIEGDCKMYEISEILASSASSPQRTRVKLSQDYEGSTSTSNNFIICGRPNRIYVSEPLEGEYFPAANFIDVEPGDGDRIMGAISNYNALVICKRNKTYVLRFSIQPATEVNVPARVSSDIGCIAPRSFAQVAVGSVWLSDRGIALYDGRSVGLVPVSDKVNDVFVDPDHPLYVRRDRNGRVIGAVGAFYPKRQQYLLLLPTVQTKRGANLMMVWDTSLNNITTYHFCQEFSSMTVAKDVDGNERVYLGDTNGFVWIFDSGNTDGVGYENATGTVRGTITSTNLTDLGIQTMVDSAASFLTGGVPSLADLSAVAGFSGLDGSAGTGLAGACIHFRPADADLDDPWETRFIYASTPTTLYVTPALDAGDYTGYEYMIGPIEFVAEFKPSNYGDDDMHKRNWQQILTHEPEGISTSLRVELLPDFQNSDTEELNIVDSTGTTGQGRTFDLSYSKGRQIKPVGRLVHNYQQVRFKNFAPDEPVRILQHYLRTTPRQSR